MNTDVDEFLAHYGVKGMRWGVRRRGSRRGTSPERVPDSKLRRRVKTGARVTAGILAVAGGVAMASASKQNSKDRAAQALINEMLSTSFTWKGPNGTGGSYQDIAATVAATSGLLDGKRKK